MMNPGFSAPIETARLCIRLAEYHDLDALLALHADAAVIRYIPHMHWKTRADADVWWARTLERREKQSAVHCVVSTRVTPGQAEVVIGTLSLFGFDAASELAEFGYLLGLAHQGKGFAREAASAFINYAFAPTDTTQRGAVGMGLRRLEATVDSRNTASNRLAQHLGFVREGVLRERWLAASKLQDIHLYGLLRRDWTSATQ